MKLFTDSECWENFDLNSCIIHRNRAKIKKVTHMQPYSQPRNHEKTMFLKFDQIARFLHHFRVVLSQNYEYLIFISKFKL